MAIELFSIGTELVLGQIQDTNAHWIAQQILQIGGELRRVTMLRDNAEEMSEALAVLRQARNIAYPHNRWTRTDTRRYDRRSRRISHRHKTYRERRDRRRLSETARDVRERSDQ